MSDQNTFHIPTATDVAAEVVLKLASMGMVVPGKSMNIAQAAEHLQCSTRQVRELVEKRKLKAGNLSTGTGEKATLRFSVVALEEFLREV